MDPIGVTLGASSLLFQVFAGCIKAYQLISEASDFEKDYQFIRIRFKTEQYRLLDFASVAQLTERDDTLIINASNRNILLEVLDQQSKMMMRFGHFDDRLRPLAKPLIEAAILENEQKQPKSRDQLASRFPHSNSLLRRALLFAEHGSKYPSRLRWVIFDREKVEQLLSRLVASNNFLQELLSSHERQMLRRQEVQTGYQIMQLNNKVDQIYEIVQAGLLPITLPGDAGQVPIQAGMYAKSGQISDSPENTKSVLVSKLVELGQFKALAAAAAADEDCLTQGFRESMRLGPETCADMPLQLRPIDIVLDDTDMDAHEVRVSGWHHPEGGSRSRVWIEWKRMDPRHIQNINDGPDPDTLRRFRALVTLLREHEQVRHFRAPPCLGYYLYNVSPTGIRYGLVFKSPEETDPHTPPTSLRDLLQDRNFIPSLTTRISLMQNITQAVEKLHSVNWLHKGLCAENIIFFQEENTDTKLSEPYLTGFDYSRPDGAVSMSSSAPRTTLDDLYRHPGVQGGPREGSQRLGYRKRHDIYSLGVVLIEIAHWKPVEEVLGIPDGGKVRVKDVISARGKLLSKENLDRIKFFVGVAVAGAAIACLTGMVAFELREADSEEDGEVAAKLQGMFYAKVVKPILETSI